VIKKPPLLKTSRQLRPLLVRLKRLADAGLDDALADVKRGLELKPSKPSRQFGAVTMWDGVRIASIAAMFDVVVDRKTSQQLMIFGKSRIATTEMAALAMLSEVLGTAKQEWSPKGKAWWITYDPAHDPRYQLILIFDGPTKTEKQTLFGGAFVSKRPGASAGRA
jgi:hypothetical protein